MAYLAGRWGGQGRAGHGTAGEVWVGSLACGPRICRSTFAPGWLNMEGLAQHASQPVWELAKSSKPYEKPAGVEAMR